MGELMWCNEVADYFSVCGHTFIRWVKCYGLPYVITEEGYHKFVPAEIIAALIARSTPGSNSAEGPSATDEREAPEALFTPHQMANALGIHRITFARWCQRYRLPGVRVNARVVRYDPKEVVQALAMAKVRNSQRSERRQTS